MTSGSAWSRTPWGGSGHCWEGCDVTATFGKTESSIIRGQYYYAVDAVNEDRYVKYRIMNNQLERVAEHPFGENTYEAGKYTHVWLDNNTLVILEPMKYYGPSWTPRP